MLRGGVLAFVSAFVLACGGPPPDTPSAVIALSPATICEGDAHRTEITIDGRSSSRHLSLVPLPPEDASSAMGDAGPSLLFAWSISGAEHTITDGTLSSDLLHVTSAGDRPLHVQLTVTNRVGGTATSLRTVSITSPTRWGSCSADSACEGGRCDVATHTCVPTETCHTDADCAPCFVCDATAGGCVPRTM